MPPNILLINEDTGYFFLLENNLEAKCTLCQAYLQLPRGTYRVNEILGNLRISDSLSGMLVHHCLPPAQREEDLTMPNNEPPATDHELTAFTFLALADRRTDNIVELNATAVKRVLKRLEEAENIINADRDENNGTIPEDTRYTAWDHETAQRLVHLPHIENFIVDPQCTSISRIRLQKILDRITDLEQETPLERIERVQPLLIRFARELQTCQNELRETRKVADAADEYINLLIAGNPTEPLPLIIRALETALDNLDEHLGNNGPQFLNDEEPQDLPEEYFQDLNTYDHIVQRTAQTFDIPQDVLTTTGTTEAAYPQYIVGHPEFNTIDETTLWNAAYLDYTTTTANVPPDNVPTDLEEVERCMECGQQVFGFMVHHCTELEL